MYVSPGFMSAKLTAYEKQRLENIKNNRMQLLAVGIDLPRMKSMGDDLFGSKQKSNIKSSKEGKNKVGYGADDEEYLPHDGEDSAHFYSADDDESARAHTTKVIFYIFTYNCIAFYLFCDCTYCIIVHGL
ncbi:hypothetical protein Dimus_039434 [Dionaea muscipula]